MAASAHATTAPSEDPDALSWPSGNVLKDRKGKNVDTGQAKREDGAWRSWESDVHQKQKEGGSSSTSPTPTLHHHLLQPRADEGGSSSSSSNRLLSIAPSGWNSSKHSSGFYAVPIIIAASVVLCVLIIIVLSVIMAFMRKRQAKEAHLKDQDAEAGAAEPKWADDDDDDDASLRSSRRSVDGDKPTSKKKRGVLKVTKLKITSVRRRRHNRKDATTTTPTTEGAASPATQATELVDESPASFAQDSHPQAVSSAVDVRSHVSATTSSHEDSSAASSSTPAPAPLPANTTAVDPPSYESQHRPQALTARQNEKRRAHPATDSSSSESPAAASSSSAADPAAPFYQNESAPLEGDNEEAGPSASRPVYDPTLYAGHIATDDKQLLAQRARLASAPSRRREDSASGQEQDGPLPEEAEQSAPAVDLDDEGFERHAADAEAEGLAPPDGDEGFLPAPPLALRSQFLEQASASAAAPTPSAPTASSPPVSLFATELPEASAPDFGSEDPHHHHHHQQHHQQEQSDVEPSAPSGWMPLPVYEAEEGGSSAPPLSAPELDLADEGESGAEDRWDAQSVDTGRTSLTEGRRPGGVEV